MLYRKIDFTFWGETRFEKNVKMHYSELNENKA